MLSINNAKTILNANRKEKLNDKEVRQVLKVLEQLALMSVEVYKNS
jgi:hypothetical protein